MSKKLTSDLLIKTKSKINELEPENKSIFENITTVHGMRQFSMKNGISFKIWLMLMMLNTVWTIAFLALIKERYNSDQIVTKIDSDCKISQVPFPAVSICNFNIVSLSETHAVAKILKTYDRDDKEIESFFRDTQLLNHFGVASRSAGNYSEIMTILRNHFFDMENVMEDVHQKCQNMLLYCEFNQKEKRCDDIFNMIQTYEGHCCAFNYAGITDEVDNALMPPDEDFEYYFDQTEQAFSPVIATHQSGRTSGLRVVFTVEPSDYPSWSLMPAYGAKILISDPNDFPETTVLYRYVTLGESLNLKVAPLVFQSDDNVRSVSPAKRGCWFHDEVELEYTEKYSYETCRTECKMRKYLETCGCVPYKYPAGKTTRDCEIDDLPCLNNMTGYWSNNEPCQPPCFLECRDKTYSMTSDTVPFYKEHYSTDVTKYRNVSELSSLQVYFGKPTCNCYKLALLTDISYFIATYGGVFSLSFGGSIITVCEILYLLFSSLAKALWRYISKYAAKNRNNINR